MKLRRLFVTSALIGSGFSLIAARAENSSEEIKALLQRIDQLEQKVRILERNRELETETAGERAKIAPAISEGDKGFVVSSGDSAFSLSVRGYVQADERFYLNKTAGTAKDTFLLRRVRPIIEGTVYDIFDYRLMLDFGQGRVTGSTAANQDVVQDAYVTARLDPAFQIQAGKFKEPVGLERLQSGRNLLFIERAYPTQLVPNRDVGIQVQGDLFKGALSYAAGIFNGVADGSSGDVETADNDKDFAGRVFAQPFKNSDSFALQGLGLGVAGTFGNQEGASPSFKSPGQQTFFSYLNLGTGTSAATAAVAPDGQHWRIAPQAYYYWGPLGVLGEYVISSQKLRRNAGATTSLTAKNTAWQVAASWYLTGEENSFKPVSPLKPFKLGGSGWGAWELAARISGLDVDNKVFDGFSATPALSTSFADPTKSATAATSWSVGVNWYLNKNIKANLNYEQTDFRGGGNTGVNAEGEKAVLSRLQFSF